MGYGCRKEVKRGGNQFGGVRVFMADHRVKAPILALEARKFNGGGVEV